jgi:hypothetical protein
MIKTIASILILSFALTAPVSAAARHKHLLNHRHHATKHYKRKPRAHHYRPRVGVTHAPRTNVAKLPPAVVITK